MTQPKSEGLFERLVEALLGALELARALERKVEALEGRAGSNRPADHPGVVMSDDLLSFQQQVPAGSPVRQVGRKPRVPQQPPAVDDQVVEDTLVAAMKQLQQRKIERVE